MSAATSTAAAGKTLLGLFDGYMSLADDKLTSETKLGGSPVYFPALTDDERKQIKRWTTCGVCGHKMFLLLQAYSPLPSMESANEPTAAASHENKGWNRMLYVFCCNTGSCARQPSSSWCAFSVQVDQEDDAALADDHDGDVSAEDVRSEPLPKKELPANTFPPCYVFVDEEPAKEVIVPTDLERELAKMAEANSRVDSNGIREEDLQELEKYVDLKDKKSDYYYEKFRSRVARAPTQVLRYHQRPVPGMLSSAVLATASAPSASQERPLFMNPQKAKRFLSVPPCECCGGALVHELQLMPTSLFYLHVGKYVNKRDRGSLTATAAACAAGSTSVGSVTSIGSSSMGGDANSDSSSALLSATGQHPCLSGDSDEGVDFGTVTVYVCARDCAMRCTASDSHSSKEEPSGHTHRRGVYMRRELVLVEEPPSLRDDRLEAEQEGGKKDLRCMVEESQAGLDEDAD